ncbi:MAG: DMT family transporter [Cellvibrionaceae bacterium]
MTKTLFLVTCALTAFAANSILCRYALGDSNIDPISFTLIRLISGAAMLALLLVITSRQNKNTLFTKGSETFSPKARAVSLKTVALSVKKRAVNAAYLFIYAITFSFAYITLDTATGALILFGVVQLCMLGHAFIKGQSLTKREWLGFTITIIGFLLLTLPYVSTPSLGGLVLMVVAGIAWAFYTLKGKDSDKALNDTSINFIIASVLAIPICALLLISFDIGLIITPTGVLAAIASGALASGLGYAIWYAALPLITTAQAASSQLLVPVIAAIGGLLFLQETLSLLIIIAGMIMLGGIYLMIRR